jgi:hypothetical protein
VDVVFVSGVVFVDQGCSLDGYSLGVGLDVLDENVFAFLVI